MNQFAEGSDLGGGDTTADTTADTSTVDTQQTDDTGPASMLEAIEAAVPSVDPEVKPEAKPEEVKPEVKADTPEDLTQMPEGLTPKAQERFQKLANANKEVTAKYESVLQAVEPFQQALQEAQVTQEQFTMATEYIGLVNKGDLRGALAVMDRERAALALHLGEPLAGVDALSDFPDLRQAVDQFQITEARALEIAKGRANQNAQQAQRQQQEQSQAQREQAREIFERGQKSVDDYCKQMQSTDLDYPKIEPILVQQIADGLLEGIHPSRYAQVVTHAYKMIKATAAGNKSSPSTTALRPTGQASPSQAPKTMHEAMWGNKA